MSGFSKMATHSSTVAWKTPRTEKPGRLHSMGSQRVGHDWVTSLTCPLMGFPRGSAVKNLPAMQNTQVRSLGQEDLLEEGMATHSCIVAWRIPWTEEPGGLQSMGSQRVGHNWNHLAHLHTCLLIRCEDWSFLKHMHILGHFIIGIIITRFVHNLKK